MRFHITATTALSLFSLALAQNNVITIQVGSTASAPGGIFQFIPNSVTAPNGTVINFQYTGMPGNHSITQSTFNAPCTPVDGGFDSGQVFLPTAGLSPIPQWNLTITNDARPIWFFCKALLPAPHCVAGMVGAINAPTSGDNTMEAFRQRAAGASAEPIGAFRNGGIGATATARPNPIPNGATPFPAIETNTSPNGGGSGTNTAGSPNNTAGGSGNNGALGVLDGVSGVGMVVSIGLSVLFLI